VYIIKVIFGVRTQKVSIRYELPLQLVDATHTLNALPVFQILTSHEVVHLMDKENPPRRVVCICVDQVLNLESLYDQRLSHTTHLHTVFIFYSWFDTGIALNNWLLIRCMSLFAGSLSLVPVEDVQRSPFSVIVTRQLFSGRISV